VNCIGTSYCRSHIGVKHSGMTGERGLCIVGLYLPQGIAGCLC
jgi:hypothetical protein